MIKLRTHREDGVVISTLAVPFMAWYGPYETGISLNHGKSWAIAEGYESESESFIGHQKYCDMSKEELEKLDYIG